MINHKILHVSAAGSGTGAGAAALNLHLSLLRQETNSKILFLTGDEDERSGVYSYAQTFTKKINRLLKTTADRVPVWFYPKRKKQIFSPGLYGISLLKHPLVQWADVIHLHWVNHGFLQICDLPKFKKGLVWTMHDCWPFTGGCHHFFECRRFQASCGSCPVLGSKHDNDISHHIMQTKKQNYASLNIRFVAISDWMRQNAKAGPLLKHHKVRVIPSGIDCSFFKFKGKEKGRARYDIKSNEPVILLGAQDLDSPFKGIGLSIQALNGFTKTALTVITFGSGEVVLSNTMHKVIHLGFISSAEDLADLYNMADVFLCSSLAEGFGMTVAEAQCCGTPAIAFDNTGPSDIIVHKVSGYLSEFSNVQNLIEGINFCLEHPFNRRNIATVASMKFSIDACQASYQCLYNEIVNEYKGD